MGFFWVPFPRGTPEDPIFGPRTVNNGSDCFRRLMTEEETETSHPSIQENIPNVKRDCFVHLLLLFLIEALPTLPSTDQTRVVDLFPPFDDHSPSVCHLIYCQSVLILGKVNLYFKLTFVSKVDNYSYQLFLQQFVIKDRNMQF